MRTTRFFAGGYLLTGYMAGELCQYRVTKNADAWRVTRTGGCGPAFNAAYPTKRAAVAAVTAYAD